MGQGRKEPISICILFQMHTPVAISLTCSSSLTFAHCKHVFAIVGTTFCALDIVIHLLLLRQYGGFYPWVGAGYRLQVHQGAKPLQWLPEPSAVKHNMTTDTTDGSSETCQNCQTFGIP